MESDREEAGEETRLLIGVDDAVAGAMDEEASSTGGTARERSSTGGSKGQTSVQEQEPRKRARDCIELLTGWTHKEQGPYAEHAPGRDLRPMHLILFVLWMSSLLLFSVWITHMVAQRWEQLHSETSSTAVKMRKSPRLKFPAITVCNLAKSVKLSPMWCGSYDNSTSCHATAVHGLPNCLVYNNDKAEVYQAEQTGLADTLMIAVSINVGEYPPHSRFSGVHINLHTQCERQLGECPNELTSSLMSAPGTPRFYRMTKIANEYLNGTRHVHFEARDSDAGDFNFEKMFGSAKDTVVLGFHYTSMSEMVIKELPRYTWLSLGAEVGGVIGFMFGIGIVNVIAGLIKSAFLGRNYVSQLFV